jgi:ribosomal protein S4
MPKDACYRKVKARYRVFPSAYASGAIAKCRKVGAANYGTGGKKKKKKKSKRADGGIELAEGTRQRSKRPFRGKAIKGTAVARGCGGVMNGRRKRTKGAVTQS